MDENMISETHSSEESEGARRRRRRDVRECFSAEWAALRRKGSHQELELEWSVLCWDRESPGKTEQISSSYNRCLTVSLYNLYQPVGGTTFSINEQ